MDKEPPNAAQLRKSIARKSIPSTPNDVAVGPRDESVPPTPATKDDNVPPPPPPQKEEDPIKHTTEDEPESHPSVPEVEGPITTTIALPEGEENEKSIIPDPKTPVAAVEVQAEGTADILHTSESAGGLSTGEDKMDEISLGGESVRGDAEEEIDLS
jgi:hypothetical protein